MKISPVTGPGAIPQNGTPEHVRTAKAVAAFNKGQSSYDKPQAQHSQPPTQVVQDQSNVGVEELGAVSSPEKHISEDVQEPSIQEPQVPIPDVDTTQKAETPTEDPSLSRQFAQLSRQERALRAKAQQQEQAYKTKEAAILAREEAIKAKELEYQQGYISKSQLKDNLLQTAYEAGLTYDQVAQQMLESPSQQTDPRMLAMISKLENEIKSLKSANEETNNNYKSQQQQAYDSAIKQIRVDVDNLVKSDPNYEIINATKSSKDVVDLIVRTYNEDGILMSVEDAANEVERHIEEEALKLARLSKVTKKLQSVAPSVSSKPQQTQTQPKAQTPPPMKTLTNAAASTRQLSARERALLAFKGELK